MGEWENGRMGEWESGRVGATTVLARLLYQVTILVLYYRFSHSPTLPLIPSLLRDRLQMIPGEE